MMQTHTRTHTHTVFSELFYTFCLSALLMNDDYKRKNPKGLWTGHVYTKESVSRVTLLTCTDTGSHFPGSEVLCCPLLIVLPISLIYQWFFLFFLPLTIMLQLWCDMLSCVECRHTVTDANPWHIQTQCIDRKTWCAMSKCCPLHVTPKHIRYASILIRTPLLSNFTMNVNVTRFLI